MLQGEFRPDMANTYYRPNVILGIRNPNADISLYINSQGGDVSAGLAIMDTMHYIKSNVSTGRLHLVILAEKENLRYQIQIMIHQPIAGAEGNN